MREIMFRAKHYGKWVYGTGIIPVEVNCKFIGKYEMIQSVEYDELDGFAPLYESEEINIKTLGQYTGLKDKNGVEIYEGDILRFSDEDTAIVKFNEKYSYFMLEPIQDYYFDSDVLGHGLEYNDVEVIGNIWDNPELLKESD